MGFTLYEIESQIKAIIDNMFDTVDENGEVQVDFEALEQLKEDRKTKLENIALYIKNTEAEAAAIKAEEESLAKRRKRLENKAEGLRYLIIKSMLENGEKELATARCSAKIKTTERTEIINIENIPEAYLKVKQEIQPDKKAIKEAIKAGEVIEGAQIVQNQTIKIE